MKKITQNLMEEMHNAIKENISLRNIGIAFSGGVDSALTAKLCSDLGFQITLLTIGFKESHDIKFAKKVNEFLKHPHQILLIESNDFEKVLAKIEEKIKTNDLSWTENAIAFYYVAKLANTFNINTVVTANGLDELFCGYHAYREAICEGEQKVLELMDSKLENEVKMMKTINEVCSEFGISIIQPFLSQHFINFSKKIPISNKIKGPDDLLRKQILRELASEVGVPDISVNQRKKALQYGSQIHKALIKSK